MGLQPIKTSTSNGIPVFEEVFELIKGGGLIDATGLVADSSIAAGTPIKFDYATRSGAVVKTFKVQANATNVAVVIRVEKLSQAIVGTILGKTAGAAGRAITVIDKTSPDYDVLTVGTTLGVILTAGDVLFEAGTAGDATAAIKALPNGLLQNEIIAATGEQINVVIRGTAFERRIPGMIDAHKAAMKGIIFSQSY